MTTTLLPKEQVDILRSIGDAANVLMALLMIDRLYPGRSTKVDEFVKILGKDKRVIEKRLDSLCGADRVIFDGYGYVLMEGGRALFLAAAPSLTNPLSKLENGSESLNWDVIEALAPTSPREDEALSPDNEQALEAQALNLEDAQSVQEGQTSHARNARALEEVEDSLTLIKKDESSSTYLDAQNVRALRIEQVFAKSNVLFGETVLLRRDASLEYAIGVFAHVYTLKDKSSFHFPARVAWTMMRDEKEPREEFTKAPWKYLSSEYLEALHLVCYQCNACPSPMYGTRKELDDHIKQSHPQVVICEECGVELDGEEAFGAHWEEQHRPKPVIKDDSVLVPINGRMNAEQAWQSVLGQLQMEMPRASFGTWVRDTKAVSFDGATLKIGVRNAYAREWLESRLASTVSRLLVGIMNQTVAVMFVVSE